VNIGLEVRSLDIQQPSLLNYSPDGQTLLIGTQFESRLVLWNLWDATTALLKGHTRPILYADFTADGNTAVSLDSFGNLLTWDTRRGDIVQILPGEQAWLNSAANELLTLDQVSRLEKSRLRRFDLTTFTELGSIALPTSALITAFSTDFRYVLLQSHNSSFITETSYRVVEVNSGAELDMQTFKASGENSSLTIEVRFIPNSSQALIFSREDTYSETGESTGTVNWWLWDFAAQTLEPYDTLMAAAPDALMFTGITADGTAADLVQPDPENYGSPQRLDLATGTPLPFEPSVTTIPGDATLYVFFEETGGTTTNLQLKEVGTDTIVETIRLEGQVYSGSVVIDPTQNQMVIAYNSGGGGGGQVSPALVFGTGASTSAFYLRDRATGSVIRDFGDNGYEVLGFVDNYTRLIAITNAGVVIYRHDNLASLIEWTCAERYIPALTDEERAFYRITSSTSLCEAR
jgi:WD40 repeat protein